MIVFDKDSLSEQMNTYRSKGGKIPDLYIEVHRMFAHSNIQLLLKTYNYRMIAHEMINDGYPDGMKVLRIICEDIRHRLHDIRWSDANGGCYMKYGSDSGCQTLLKLKVENPGFL